MEGPGFSRVQGYCPAANVFTLEKLTGAPRWPQCGLRGLKKMARCALLMIYLSMTKRHSMALRAGLSAHVDRVAANVGHPSGFS